ncbi:MAG: TetR/AcrR family transcriptional regulator [Alphaproteobacteria bacterium]|nr:TetR/AcrR family transcriptional regulator [Alphaproteobacteria bacterium SS10]
MSDPYETRARINQAALNLFAEQGVEATTTKDIAKAAGIAEGTIYRHYVSKDDLVWDLFSTNYVGFADRLDALAAEHSGLKFKLLVVIRHFCELFDNDPALYRFLLLVQHRNLHRLKAGTRTPVLAMSDIIADAMQAGEIPEQDVNLATAFVLGIVMQPATFHVYGRLGGKMVDHVPALANAAYNALGGKAAQDSAENAA